MQFAESRPLREWKAGIGDGQRRAKGLRDEDHPRPDHFEHVELRGDLEQGAGYFGGLVHRRTSPVTTLALIWPRGRSADFTLSRRSCSDGSSSSPIW